MNICFLGLSGSGKTTYLYSMSNLLKLGVSIQANSIVMNSSSLQQGNFLNNGFLKLLDMSWPPGSNQTNEYTFNFSIDGEEIDTLTMYDFPGGMLKTGSSSDLDKLFEKFEASESIIILVDGVTIKNLSSENNSLKVNAVNDINYIELLIKNYYRKMRYIPPILLTITKRDIFTPKELSEGKNLLKKYLPTLFGTNSNIVVGITTVTLGKNLKNTQGILSGTLFINDKGDIHIPILFAILMGINLIIDNKFDFLKRLLSQKVELYKNGKEAHII